MSPRKRPTPKDGKSPAKSVGKSVGKSPTKSAGKPRRPTAAAAKSKWPAPEATPASLGDLDLHLLGEGRHLHLHDVLGGHLCSQGGQDGARFAVWAPGAKRLGVAGDFNGWHETDLPLRKLADSGVWERFVPGARAGQRYKFVIESREGVRQLRCDPFARAMEQPPGNAAVLCAPSSHVWSDRRWMARRPQTDHARSPISIYEVHLGSWLRSPDGPLTFAQALDTLVGRVAELGFTHVELMPVMEHPFGGSWGYQVTGYFAPTSRWGSADQLRALIDAFHQRDIGVILDWVPAHFPRDDHALHRFDGTAVFEHLDPRKGHHPDWDTAIFNFGRPQVANFLLASALHWLQDYHADGLRTDAVASMLYLDYSRGEGQWEPNEHGGRENLDAVQFLRRLNTTLREQVPGCLLIAEESTTWPGVTRPVEHGGLGFDLKWNMGWMHDTLEYFSTDPLFRGGVHEKLTFGLFYEFSERFLMPLSHDEVVHGKGSLLGKMPGNEEQRFANLKALLAYQFTRPGKQLVFMGTELGSLAEWDHDGCLDWHLLEDPRRAGLHAFVVALGALYKAHPCLWKGDPDDDSFAWIECDDKTRSVFAFQRRWKRQHLVVVLNLTPVAHRSLPLGLPRAGSYEVLLDSADSRFGGPGGQHGARIEARRGECHKQPARTELNLAGLSVQVLGPVSGSR